MMRIFDLITAHDMAPADLPDGIDGVGASSGAYVGPVRLVANADDFGTVQPGDILVAPITTTPWEVLFPHIGALVTEAGVCCHTRRSSQESTDCRRSSAVLAQWRGSTTANSSWWTARPERSLPSDETESRTRGSGVNQREGGRNERNNRTTNRRAWVAYPAGYGCGLSSC